MNGIEPPTPMSTGAVPSHASAKAARAASYAGPVASIWVASPVSTTVMVSSAPQGTCFSRCSRRRSTALAVVSPGAIRIEIRQRAAGTRVLLAPATLGASRPVIESAGLVQSRSTVEPSPIQPIAGTAPDSARSRSSGYSTSAAGPACRPVDRDVAAVVVQRRDQPGEGHQRVGDEPAPHAGVHGVGQRADLDVHPDQAAQAGRQGGDADVPVAGVGDHDDVGAQVVEVLLQQRGQGLGADLLLALDEEDDVDRQVVAEDPQRGQVGGDAGLVVGRAAAVEPVAALGRLERRAVPVGVVVLGLDVVVGVEQHGRRARRAPPCGRSPPARRRRRW